NVEVAVTDENDIRTRNPLIDGTTEKLTEILVREIKNIGAVPHLSPQQFGTLVHQNFANAVRAAVLPGIAYDDVETTFPEGPYGSPGSVRTDVVLRDVSGKIIAIYDVKTGESGLTEKRINQLLRKTGASPDTRVIELRFNG